MDTAGGQVNYRPSLSSDGADRLTIAFTNNRLYRLLPDQAAESDVARLETVDGTLPAALARYRENISRTIPLDARTPFFEFLSNSLCSVLCTRAGQSTGCGAAFGRAVRPK